MSGFPCPADADVEPDYEKIGPTRILPHLFIGCMQDALNDDTRKVNNITHILNVTMTCPKPELVPEQNFHRIPINDGYVDVLLPYINEACEFIDKVRSVQGIVLVHCMAGISRSAAITIAYIMKSKMFTCEQAYRFVKTLRPIVSPNFNFLGQLLEYQKTLNITMSPSSSAGTKRKRFDLDLGLTSHRSEPSSHTSSPVHTKRLYVNNNTISSLSPASAMANLRFEHTLEALGASAPSAACDSPLVESRPLIPNLPMNPPKRCHSWNGLAELASKMDSPILSTGVQVTTRTGLAGGPCRPRSLNLSMSNLSVPPAVIELNAQVTKSVVSKDKGHYRSSSVIPQISEETEVISNSDTESNRDISSSTSSLNTNKLNQPNFFEIEESKSDDVITPRLGASDLSASQPSLSTPSPNEEDLISLNSAGAISKIKHAKSSPDNSKYNITSALTAPSNLNKSSISNSSAYLELRRRSKSLENLISRYDSAPDLKVCHKCGRIDSNSICHGLTHSLDTNNLNKPDSIHSSAELIQVI